MSRAVYAATDVRLVKVGWPEIFRDENGTLVAVPSISNHAAAEYLHTDVPNDSTVIVTVHRRAP